MHAFRRMCFGLVAACLLAIALPALAHASDSDELTFFTFNKPVALPGVALPAGTYAFTVIGDQIVRVCDQRNVECYGTFLTIPDVRLRGLDRADVVLGEPATAGDPEPVKAWFYPGEGTGHEFIYSRNHGD